MNRDKTLKELGDRGDFASAWPEDQSVYRPKSKKFKDDPDYDSDRAIISTKRGN